MLGRVFLGRTSTKQGLMCLAQGHNTVMPVRPEPGNTRSRVKHSTTELLHSLYLINDFDFFTITQNVYYMYEN